VYVDGAIKFDWIIYDGAIRFDDPPPAGAHVWIRETRAVAG